MKLKIWHHRHVLKHQIRLRVAMRKVLSNKSRFIKLFLAGTGFLPFMFSRLATKNNVNRNTDNKSVSVKSHTYRTLLRNRHACPTQSVSQTQGRFFFCLLSTQWKQKIMAFVSWNPLASKLVTSFWSVHPKIISFRMCEKSRFYVRTANWQPL